MTIAKLCKLLDQSESLGQRFPLIKTLLNITCTLPISNAEVERIFSQLKLIMTDKRNKLKVENANKLLLVKLNKFDNFDEAVRKWKSQKNRRLFMS